jgi:hypothetical protein
MNIEQLITHANPVPASNVAAGDSPAARETLTAILGQRRRSRRPMPGLVLGAVAAAVVVAVAVTQLLPGPAISPRPVTRPGQTVAGLNSLALAAAAQPSHSPLKRGQFEYTDEVSASWIDTYNATPATSYNVRYTERRQVWVATDGAGRILETYSDPWLPPGKNRAGWIAAGRPSLRVGPARETFRPGKNGLSVGVPGLLKLPTNPRKLAALIFSGKVDGGPLGPGEDFVRVGDLLRETYAPPKLRAAIFKVAEMIPGVRVLGMVTDPKGTSGIALAHTHHLAARGQVPGQDDKSVLIFNPKTSALVAEETYVTYTRTGRTTLTAWTVYLKSGVVSSLHSTTPLTSGDLGDPASA